MDEAKKFSDGRMQMAVCQAKEQVMEKNGCVATQPDAFLSNPFTYCLDNEWFQLVDIDHVISKEKSQCRIKNKLDPDYVSRYRLAMLEGATFPALAVYWDKDLQTWLIGDGFHTLAALLELGITEVRPIYKFSHPEVDLVNSQFNVYTTGYSEPGPDVVEKAVRAWRAKELTGEKMPSEKEFAAKFLLSEKRFNLALRVDRTRKWLARQGVDVDKIDHNNSFDAISKIQRVDEELAAEVGKLAAQCGLGAKDVENIAASLTDAAIPAAKKAEVFAKHRDDYLALTSNGKRKATRSRPRCDELILRQKVGELASLCKKVDVDNLRKVMADKDHRANALEVYRTLSRIVK